MTTERRSHARREEDALHRAIVEELLKLESLPYGDSDGTEIRSLLAKVVAMDSRTGGNDHV